MSGAGAITCACCGGPTPPYRILYACCANPPVGLYYITDAEYNAANVGSPPVIGVLDGDHYNIGASVDELPDLPHFPGTLTQDYPVPIYPHHATPDNKCAPGQYRIWTARVLETLGCDSFDPNSLYPSDCWDNNGDYVTSGSDALYAFRNVSGTTPLAGGPTWAGSWDSGANTYEAAQFAFGVKCLSATRAITVAMPDAYFMRAVCNWQSLDDICEEVDLNSVVDVWYFDEGDVPDLSGCDIGGYCE